MDIVRLIIAVVTGVVAGSAVNMGLILLGPSIIPPPAGVDMSTTQGMQAGIHLLTAKHFVFPFLAHALGTFTGALVTYLISRKYRNRAAWGMGLFFLAGGVVAANLIPAPGWFIATDLALAYLPMAWLAILLGDKLTNHPAS
ncbi:MAG: hypothetical protein NXH95_18855 [Pseudomonadaceae bacterium]|nr:hypothetical protein [Pseudomonadaceae bacterium]